MSNIIGLIESAMADADHGNEAVAAVETFLQIAAKRGWHMRPDEATEEMGKVSGLVYKCRCGDRITMWGINAWHAMLAAAPEFKWKDDS